MSAVTPPHRDWRLLSADERYVAEATALFSMGLALAETAGALADRSARALREEDTQVGSPELYDLVMECARELLHEDLFMLEARHNDAQQRCSSLSGVEYLRYFSRLVDLGVSALIAITPAGVENLSRKVRLHGAVHVLATASSYARLDARPTAPLLAMPTVAVAGGSGAS